MPRAHHPRRAVLRLQLVLVFQLDLLFERGVEENIHLSVEREMFTAPVAM